MPSIPVALNRKLSLSVLNNQVDPLSGNRVLGNHAITRPKHPFAHVTLKAAVAELRIPLGRIARVGIVIEMQQTTAHTLGMQVALTDAMKQPHLVPRPRRRHVKPLPVFLVDERPGTAFSVDGCDHAEEHDVALVALEAVGVAAQQPSLLVLERLWADRVQDHVLNQLRLGVPLQADDSERLSLVPRVVQAVDHRLGDCRGFGPVDGVLGLALAIAVFYQSNLNWRQARRRVLPEWNQRRIGVTPLVGKADNLWHAAEVLSQGNAVSIAHVRLVKEAKGGVKRLPEGNPHKPLFHQRSNLASVDKSHFWRDLFLVADNYTLLGEVL